MRRPVLATVTIVSLLLAALGAVVAPALGGVPAGSSNDAADVAVPVAAAPLNLRTGPSLNSRIATVIPAGTELALAGEGTAGFVPVVHEGETGWVYAAYVAPPSAVAVTGVELATVTDALNLRAGPSPNDDVVLVIPAGGVVVVRDEAQDRFLPVAYDGIPGFAAVDYLVRETPAAGREPDAGS